MNKVKVTLVKSYFGRSPSQTATLHALGLTKLNRSRIHISNNSIKGMINRVQHLIKVEEIS